MTACDRENRNASVRIDLAAIRHNLDRLKSMASGKRVMAVVKADGYGHGAAQILPALTAADALAVAYVEEGVALRRAGEVRPVMVFQGYRSTAQLDECMRFDLWPVIHHREQVEMLQGGQQGLSCWVKFDTGMGRLGFATDRVQTVYRKLHAAGVNVVGIMSHLASANRENDISTDRQIRLFKTLQWPEPVARSLANSAAIVSRPDAHFDWVRAGICLYGASPFTSVEQGADRLGLQPAMRVTAPVTAIRNLNRGDRIGYGGHYECRGLTKIAIVGAGYGDGYPRGAPNGTSVMLGNWRCPVLGLVSMDSMVVDITELPVPPPIDYPVTLWGHAQLGVDEIARNVQSISYELLCTVRGQRSWRDATGAGNVRRLNEDSLLN